MRRFSVLSIAAAAGALASVSWPASAETGSGAPYGARDPVNCATLAQPEPPSAEQAALLIRCKRETITGSGELWLMENVDVEIGGERPFIELYESVTMPDADVSRPVHPIRGAWTWATCMTMEDAGRYGGDPNLNCRETEVTGATGACWRTTFGDWQCAMNGRSGSASQPTRAPR